MQQFIYKKHLEEHTRVTARKVEPISLETVINKRLQQYLVKNIYLCCKM